jgi:hypothetical protein
MIDQLNQLIADLTLGFIHNPMYYIGFAFAIVAFGGLIRFLWGALDYISALGHADEQAHGGSNMYQGVLFLTGMFVMWEVFRLVVDFFFGV